MERFVGVSKAERDKRFIEGKIGGCVDGRGKQRQSGSAKYAMHTDMLAVYHNQSLILFHMKIVLLISLSAMKMT